MSGSYVAIKIMQSGILSVLQWYGTLLSDPQWTQIQIRLGHKSIIDYIITDKALIKCFCR